MTKQFFLLAILLFAGRLAVAQNAAADAVPVQAPYPSEQPVYPHSEGILQFHADIVIYPSGMLHVREKIKVYAAGASIRKGIFRTIPVYRKDVYGRNVHTGIHVGGVLKNGQPEPYSELEEHGELTVRIGDADVLLQEGIYEYDITYETGGQIGFFDGYDELYWNVTGSNWSFPIEKASAAITVPYGAQVLQTACYTGPDGSTATDCRTSRDSSGTQVFHTNNRLESGSGFTIAVGFSPGLITRPPPPTAMEKLISRLMRYREYWLAVLGGLIMFGYSFFTWRKHGKDPEQPIPVPAFEPPDGLSPGSIRYLHTRSADNTGFTATIVNMAIKKAIHIKKDDAEYVLEKTGEQPPNLLPEEKAIYARLFSGRNKIRVDDAYHGTFSKAQSAFKDSMTAQHDLKKYFLSNSRQIAIGGLIAGAILIGYLMAVNIGQFFFLLFLLPFLGVGGSLLVTGIRNLKQGCTGVILTLVGGAFTLAPLGVLFLVMDDVPGVALIFVLALLAAYFWYIYLIKAPTPLGAEKASKIEGFMMYLKTAEEHRLNMLTPPEHTPALFERLLPYAIALGLENEWGSKFENVLAQAGYSPEWYDGDTINYRNFSNSFGSGFTSSLMRAQVDPTPPSSSSSGSSGSSSWSSGSSGGGSSGGGGGGGGGGGW
ncbi:DUF2207 domain-containing protein [Chitinophaga lutea]|uniref:DUF2207 domain-containing protein n=1 Tax=Chitinophaga lutea TaxID=2488634 RepID=A0A3N4PIW9_9BACT|nr:DUF2207 domain-containing protein [Chitinophaga lutea]RPE08642.1 DUF2207 domain-containing protein [Chitinophaga lutea]